MKVIEIFKANDERKLVLPDFQRDFEWKEPDQRRLLSSFLVSLPIGSLLLLHGGKDDFAAKKLCFPREQVNPKEDCLYLLDGQQRISSLKGIFSDFFSEPETWKDVWDNIYNNLRFRWFLRAKQLDSADEDLFGCRNLHFKQIKYEPEQIIDYIESKRIYKTKTEDWYNPGFCPKDDEDNPLEDNRKIVEIAKYAIKENLVPLYTLYNPSPRLKQRVLHKYVIEQIANNRVSELKADVDDGVADIVELLEYIEPNINQLIRDKEKEQIDFAWSRLSAKWSQDMISYLDGLLEQDIHIIELPSDEIGRATSIFENINRGGTPLDVYDLIVAKAARDRNVPSLTQRIVKTLTTDIQNTDTLGNGLLRPLPDTWNAKCMETIDDNKPSKIIKNQYLNLLSIFCHCEYGNVDAIKVEHIKKNKQLELNDEQINKNTNITIEALKRACAFLHFRCGVVHIINLPYELMILPIAYVFKDDSIWTDKSSIARIEYWYWCSIFGGAYRERPNERCIRDIKNLFCWLKGSENKFESLEKSILNDSGYSDLNTLLLKDEDHPVTSAMRNAILQYVLSKQPKDFLPLHEVRLNTWDIANKKYFEYKGKPQPLEIQDHHIYPLGSATTIGESSRTIRSDKKHILNSPLNRTYISSLANKLIRDKSPEEYLKYISKSTQWGHCMPASSISENITDKTTDKQFEAVLKCRYKEILRDITTELEKLKSV